MNKTKMTAEGKLSGRERDRQTETKKKGSACTHTQKIGNQAHSILVAVSSRIICRGFPD